MNEKDDITSFFGEPISVYTDSQGIEDGILIPTGHPLITLITSNAYHTCIEEFSKDGLWEQFASTKEKYERKLLSKLIESVIIEIQKQYIKDNKKADTFYSVEARGWKFFVAQNESGFTLMFPEDY
ncbi:MAG: hypothetical protein WA130_02285 [Candidatus Methanoperedens sp.]